MKRSTATFMIMTFLAVGCHANNSASIRISCSARDWRGPHRAGALFNGPIGDWIDYDLSSGKPNLGGASGNRRAAVRRLLPDGQSRTAEESMTDAPRLEVTAIDVDKIIRLTVRFVDSDLNRMADGMNAVLRFGEDDIRMRCAYGIHPPPTPER